MGQTRRQFLARSSALVLAAAAPAGLAEGPAIRIGLTPVILDDQTRFLGRWRDWMERRLGREVQFIRRPRYRDITDLLLSRALDAAWICSYPYVQHRSHLRLLGVPVYQGDTHYRSLIIRARENTQLTSIHDLANSVFAYSDPDSNSGYLYPVYRLRETLRESPDFFRRTFFTGGHRNTIEAVALRVADAGAVDSYVWETVARQHPDYRTRIAVIERSPEFGFPPVVTHVETPEELRQQLSEALLRMHEDDEGQRLLGTLGLDRFVAGDEGQYASIDQMWVEVQRLGLIAQA